MGRPRLDRSARLTARLPTTLAARLRDEAARRGCSINDLLVALLSAALPE